MPETDDGDDGAGEIAAWAVEKAIGARPRAVTPETTGLSNRVFRVDAGKDGFIVRLGDAPGKLDGYAHERQVIEHVKAIGVPVVEVVAVGLAKERPFMIARRTPGEPALHHPKRLEILGEIGRLAGRIHTIRTTGYGSGFGWPDETHHEARTWREWLDDDFHPAGRLETLRKNELISDRQEAALQTTLATVEQWDDLPVLHHGDIRLKNVLVDEEGAIQAVIDWEDSVSSVGPHWDLSIALHDLSIDAKEAFLHGYGMKEEVVRESAPVWRLFNLLNYAATVEKMSKDGDRAGLDRLRTRLSGSLDLYGAT